MNSGLLAQSLQIGDGTGKFELSGPLENINTLGDLVNKLQIIIMPLAGLILLGVFISGGYDLLTSQGGEKMKSGKAKLTAGLVGFVIMALAYLFTKILAQLFNLRSGIL